MQFFVYFCAMKSPIVTIIIPAFNAERFLTRAVDSVLRQRFDGTLEIVIVDDGSSDDTLNLARQLATGHTAIKVVHQANGGLMAARHTGLENAAGEWIMFLDADDTLVDDCVTRLYNYAIENNLDFLAGSLFTQFKPDGQFYHERRPYEGSFDGQQFLQQILKPDGNLPNWAGISRKTVWRDAFPPTMLRVPAEDRLLNAGIASNIKRGAINNDIAVVNYHVNAKSLTSTGSCFKLSMWKTHFEYLRQRLGDSKFENDIRLLEIDALSFNTGIDNRGDEWYQQVAHYPSAGMPLKYKILLFLLKCPALCRFTVKNYHRLKSLTATHR